jgi:hypothetical protein
MGENRVAVRGIAAAHRPLHLGQDRQRRERDPHVVHRLVVAAVGRDHVGAVEDVVEGPPHLVAHRRGPALDRRMPLDRPQADGGSRQVAHEVVVVGDLLGVGEEGVGQLALGPVHEVLREAVLQRVVEAGIAVEPVEREGELQRVEVEARAAVARWPRAAQLFHRAAGVALVAAQQVGEGPAGEVVRGRSPPPTGRAGRAGR